MTRQETELMRQIINIIFDNENAVDSGKHIIDYYEQMRTKKTHFSAIRACIKHIEELEQEAK